MQTLRIQLIRHVPRLTHGVDVREPWRRSGFSRAVRGHMAAPAAY